jgi:hypothetical protein
MGTWLRIVGIGINVLGAVILALRVKELLDVMIQTQESHELNFRILVDKLNGDKQVAPMIFGMTEHVARAQKRGIWLLVFGFTLLAVGNGLVAMSWYVEAHGDAA